MGTDGHKQSGDGASRARRVGWRALLLVLVVGFGILFWREVVRPRVVLKRWGTVVPGRLYRSGQVSRELVRSALRDHGIRLVIDLSERRPDDRDQRAELEAARELGIEFHRFPLSGDGRGDPQYYVEALAMAHAAMAEGRPVLVHCTAGAQRIGGFVALYRVLVEGWTSARAKQELEAYGWRARRDAVLLDYLNEQLPVIAAGLVERGVIAQVPDPLPRF